MFKDEKIGYSEQCDCCSWPAEYHLKVNGWIENYCDAHYGESVDTESEVDYE